MKEFTKNSDYCYCYHVFCCCGIFKQKIIIDDILCAMEANAIYIIYFLLYYNYQA